MGDSYCKLGIKPKYDCSDISNSVLWSLCCGEGGEMGGFLIIVLV